MTTLTLDVETPTPAPAVSPSAVPNLADTPDPAAEVTPDVLPEKPKAERKPRAPRAPRAPRTPRAAGTRAKRLDIASNMTQLYAAVGIGLSMVPSPQAVGHEPGVTVTAATGLALAEHAEACGQAWAKAADESPAVRDALEKLLTVSVWGAVISAHVPIILSAAAAAGAIPPALGAMLAGGDARP